MNFKNIVIYTVVVVFILFILLIAYNNVAETTVNLKFIGIKEFSVPAWAVMVASFMIGLIVAFLWGLIVSALQGIESLTTKRMMKVKTRINLDYQSGLQLMLKGDYAEAEELFKKILKTDGKDLKTLTALGNALRKQGKNHEAEEYHLKALLLDENYLPALEGLYDDYICKNKTILARNTIDKILDHKDADVLKYKQELVKIHIHNADWDNAIKVQNDVYKSVGRGEKKEAQSLLNNLEYQKASAQLDSEESREAEKTLKKLKDKNKGFVAAYVRLGQYYIKNEEYALAFKVLTEGYHATMEPVFLTMIEDLYITTNQPDDAIAFFKKLSERYPEEILPIFTLGKLYYRFEIMGEALNIFDNLLAKVDYSPTLEYYLSKANKKEGNKDEAIESLKKIIRKSGVLDLSYSCRCCGYTSSEWVDRCPECGCWNCIYITPRSELNVLEVRTITPPRSDY